jgi:hypothetical protein
VEFVFDTLMVGVVLGEYFVHFLTVGVLLCRLDGFSVLGLDSLDSVVVIFEGDDHFSDRFYILNKLLIDTLILLLLNIVFIRVGLLIEILIGHGLIGHVKVLKISSKWYFLELW